MKIFPFLLILFSMKCLGQGAAPTSGNSKELTDKGLKLYAIEKALIIYDVADQPNDTLVVLFDRFGWRQVTMEHGEKLYYGLKTKVNTKEIIDGETTFTMNLREKKGKVRVNKDLSQLAGYKSPDEIFIAQMAKIKATKTGTENILDKECEVWEYESRGKKLKIWSWHGVPLKHISTSGTQTALSINLNPEINELVFVPPADVQLVME